MRVLLVSANTERINMPTPPLGAAMVASATRRRGHQVELVDLLGADDDLLEPCFYLAPAVAGWVEETVRSRDWSTPVLM